MKRTIIVKLKERPRFEKKSDAKHPNFNLREIALQALYQIDLGAAPLEEVLKLTWVHSNLTEENKQLIYDIGIPKIFEYPLSPNSLHPSTPSIAHPKEEVQMSGKTCLHIKRIVIKTPIVPTTNPTR